MTALTSTEAQDFVGLYRAATDAGFRAADFVNILDALKSPNRVAALRQLLDAETRPAVRRGLEAGIAVAEEAEK
jgi:hypothetical protein